MTRIRVKCPVTTISMILLLVSTFGFINQRSEAVITFGNTINVSSGEGFSSFPQILVTESGRIYIVWEDTSSGAQEIFFSASVNGGTNFSLPVNISDTTTPSTSPRIAIQGDDIYVVWVETLNLGSDIIFASGSVDADGNASFETKNISNNPVGNSGDPEIVSSGDQIYVAWSDDVDGSTPPDVFFANSTDGGLTFGEHINVSGNNGVSTAPKMAISPAGHIYVAWQDDSQNSGSERAIYFSSSIDEGNSFSDPISLSTPAGFAGIAGTQAVSDEIAAVLWNDFDDIFLATVELDTGGNATVNGPVNVSNDDTASDNPQFEMSGSGTINIVWRDRDAELRQVLHAKSEDGGDSFSSPPAVVSTVTNFPTPKLARSDSSNVFIVWDDGSDVFFAASIDDGTTFSDPVNISTNDETSEAPVIAASGTESFVAWVDLSPGNPEILFRTVSTDLQPSIVIIEDVSEVNPKWGDEIEVVGTSNGEDGDSVVIDWGDGSLTPDIHISGSSWGPVSHIYNSTSTGSAQIIATLVDSEGAAKAVSEPEEVTVAKHQTSLSLSNIKSVLAGSNITATGLLTDVDNNSAIQGGIISFNGTGATGIDDVLTDSDGGYLSQGASANSSETLLTVQAVFGGDMAYELSVSEIMKYDTAPTSAQVFSVPAGSPTRVDLADFGAEISFDQVSTNGTVFVYDCEAPVSERYLPLESSCLAVSSAVEQPPGSSAHITMSYEGKVIPAGHSSDEIDIFHLDLGGAVDITESRNLADHAVTGRTTDFSEFVVGVALHDSTPADAIRKQVFVGSNELIFNEITTSSFQFNADEYELGSLATAAVVDDRANKNNLTVDSITAIVTSSSDAVGITLGLNESGVDTGVFEGSVVLGSESSSAARLLRADAGDDIVGTYNLTASAPFRITFDEIAEAGLVELSNYTVGSEVSFDTIGNAYEVRLVDAQLGVGDIHLTMSYVNVPDEADLVAENFRLAQRSLPDPEGDAPWADVSLPNLPGTHVTSGLDADARTISGTTDFLSQFAIASGFTPPGGGGGGLPRPGTGIILFDSATVRGEESRDRSSSGAGGGGSRSASVAQTPSGTDVETSVTTDSGTIVIRFETVQEDSGQLKINSNEPSSFEELFDEIAFLSQDNDQHGTASANGATYATASDVFDIDASSVNHDGAVDVTIPYDEDTVVEFGAESNVRFLHYNEELGIWEDKTAGVDEAANTVTGTLNSLSPVVAAIIIDGEGTFQENKMSWVEIADPSLSVLADEQVTLYTSLENTQSVSQDYILLVQVVDGNNVAQHIGWKKGSLEANQHSDVSTSWSGLKPGDYRVQVLLLTNFENPELLSEAIYTDLLV